MIQKFLRLVSPNSNLQAANNANEIPVYGAGACYEHQDVAIFKDYLCEQLPKRIQNDLNSSLHFRNVPNSLLNEVPEMVRRHTTALFNEYSRPLSSPSTTPSDLPGAVRPGPSERMGGDAASSSSDIRPERDSTSASSTRAPDVPTSATSFATTTDLASDPNTGEWGHIDLPRSSNPGHLTFLEDLGPDTQWEGSYYDNVLFSLDSFDKLLPYERTSECSK
jgi:hypothetical protein